MSSGTGLSGPFIRALVTKLCRFGLSYATSVGR